MSITFDGDLYFFIRYVDEDSKIYAIDYKGPQRYKEGQNCLNSQGFKAVRQPLEGP